MQTLTDTLAHRQALRCTASLWYQLFVEGRGDPAEISSSALIGRLKHLVNGSPVYVVAVQGTAQSCCGETYPIDQTVTIELSENGELVGHLCTEQEFEQAEQYSRSEGGVEYGC